MVFFLLSLVIYCYIINIMNLCILGKEGIIMTDFNKMAQIGQKLFENHLKEYLKSKRILNNFSVKELFIKKIIYKANSAYLDILTKQSISLESYGMLVLDDWIDIIYERHYAYSNQLNDFDRLDKLNDNEYAKRIVSEVVSEMLVNKQIGSKLNNLPIFSKPETSRLMMTVNIINEISRTINGSNDQAKAVKSTLNRISDQLKAIVLLMHYQNVAEAITIWRSFYESELTFIILINWPEELAKEYLLFLRFMELENNIEITQEEREEIEGLINTRLELYKVSKSKAFINYGWIMKTQEFHENNYKLNIKEGLAQLADSHLKYNDYQIASSISHSALFTRKLDFDSQYSYIFNLVVNSLNNIIDPLKRILSIFQYEYTVNIKYLDESIALLDEFDGILKAKVGKR